MRFCECIKKIRIFWVNFLKTTEEKGIVKKIHNCLSLKSLLKSVEYLVFFEVQCVFLCCQKYFLI